MALKDIIGQESAIKILKSAILNGKVGSAYLFQGPSGTGKCSTAINFIKALNCRQQREKEGADACDACSSCGRIEEEIHPDVFILRPEKGVIKIDEIRELERALSLCPYEGGYKAAVVDDAHLMNEAAANAFLKCLEEPPSGSIIVLVSPAPERLPETIRSRCLVIKFKPLSEDQMEFLLREKVKDRQMRRALIGLSMGRPGLALGKSGGILKKRQEFLKSLHQILSGSGTPSWTDKESIEEFMDGLELFLRDLLVLRATGREELLLNPVGLEEIKSFGKAAKEEVIIDCYNGVSGIKKSLVYNPNKTILWNYTAGMIKKLSSGEAQGF